MLRVHLTLKSTNKKTGPIPVSTTSAGSCPADCPFMGSGCYAESGPLAIHWKKVSAGERGDFWDDFCRKVRAFARGTFWRHNQAGDLPHIDGGIDAVNVAKLVRANAGKLGFTYSHHDCERNYANWETVRHCNAMGFTVNLSGNDLAHADRLADLGIAPVVVVLPAAVHGRADIATPAGRKVVVCPATYLDGVSCDTCRLCQVRDRPVIVGFPAHGSGARKADAVAHGAAS
jgi:hypothetical protein